MGLIAKQTIKGSIYSYLGAFIGFVNVALLMPQIFTTDEIGLTTCSLPCRRLWDSSAVSALPM